MKNTLALAVVLFAARAAAAQQAPDTVRLQEIVVTATRVPMPHSSVPATVNVMYGDELRRRGVRSVDEALRSVSGAAVVETGSYGASTALFLRGGESDYVKVLVDGVQVNSPGEQFNWATLSIEDIERIEIVKGPASVLYGSDAVAGVVQLITKRKAGTPRGQLIVSAGRGNKVGAQANGSFANESVETEVAGGSETLSYSAGVAHFGSDGAYAFNNRYHNTSVTARATLHADARTVFNGSVRADDNRFHYPTDDTGQPADRNQFHDGGAFSAGLDATRQLSPRLQAIASLSHSRNDDATDDQPDSPGDTIGFYRYRSDERFQRDAADVRLNYRIADRSTVTAGTELEWQSNRGSSTSPFGDAAERTESRNNRAVYAQWLGSLRNLSLQLGARGEDNEKFGRFGTYRAGVSAQLTRVLRLRASAGTGFKAPRFFEQFAQGYVKGNPALKPEQSRSWEFAFDAALGRGRVTASYFNQKFRDLIQYVSAPAQAGDPNYLNLAAAHANGAEIETSWLLAGMTVTGSYTRLATRVVDDGTGDDASFAAGQPLLRRPRNSGSLGVSGLHAHLDWSVGANYVGKRDDVDFSTYPYQRIALPAYTRVDVAGGYQVARAVTATFKIENALAATYEEVRGFPARGRVSYVGARVTF